ncbi:hypothetical protein LZ32DRAFT_598596 [Colletotrichum eremochloae]|nr:hypothetical protein LZ32DRAFT_598596 [Colletotrichum eremochloae]
MGDGREEFFSVSVALNPYTVEAYCRESPQRKQFLGVGTGYMAGGGRKRLGTHRRRRLLQSDPQVSGQISSRGSKAGTGRGLARATVCWGPDRPMLVDERYIGKTLSLGAGWMECVEGETWCVDGVRFRCRYELFSHIEWECSSIQGGSLLVLVLEWKRSTNMRYLGAEVSKWTNIAKRPRGLAIDR